VVISFDCYWRYSKRGFYPQISEHQAKMDKKAIFHLDTLPVGPKATKPRYGKTYLSERNSDRRDFLRLMDAIEEGNVVRFTRLFPEASDDARRMHKDYEPTEDDKDEDGEVDWSEIPFQEETLATHAFMYKRPEILRMLLLEKVDYGLDDIDSDIKKKIKRGRLEKEEQIMKLMIKWYYSWLDYEGTDEKKANRAKLNLERVSLEEPKLIPLGVYRKMLAEKTEPAKESPM
jgi:hypothetical protein